MSDVKYKIGTVAKLTGLSPFLLRAWENRYALLSPSRTDTGRRFYTDRDVELLRAVKALLDRNYSIGEVSSWAPERILSEALGGPHMPLVGKYGRSSKSVAGEIDGRDGLESLFEATKERLLDATHRLHRGAFDAAIAEASAVAPFDQIADRVLVPLLEDIGDRWATGAASISSEHFATAAIRQRLLAMIQATTRHSGRLALVACAPGDYHEIGSLLATFKLAQEGWAVTYLGANLPIDDFAEAIAKTKPELVALSMTLEVPPALLRCWLVRLTSVAGPGTRLICGGAGARPHARLVREFGFELDFGSAPIPGLEPNRADRAN